LSETGLDIEDAGQRAPKRIRKPSVRALEAAAVAPRKVNVDFIVWDILCLKCWSWCLEHSWSWELTLCLCP
jgi:hypothetical protein